jgi:hypothetical protein
MVDKIQRMDVDVIVPGHGPIGGKKNTRWANIWQCSARGAEAF